MNVPASMKPDEFALKILTQPDELGRQQFFAYWHQDKEWANGPVSHVAGQIFYAQVDEFTRVAEEEGHIVTIFEPGQPVLEPEPCPYCPPKDAAATREVTRNAQR